MHILHAKMALSIESDCWRDGCHTVLHVMCRQARALSGGANPPTTRVIEAKGVRWILDGIKRQKSGRHDKQLWETLGAYRVVEMNPCR